MKTASFEKIKLCAGKLVWNYQSCTACLWDSDKLLLSIFEHYRWINKQVKNITYKYLNNISLQQKFKIEISNS
jgi:hypothetical protein